MALVNAVPIASNNAAMPWYDKYKVEFIKSLTPVEHEFFSHPIACMF